MSRRARGSRDAAFTLIEMLASILLTSIVISVAVGFYINLSRATETATLRLRQSRHAATILDRVARDLQSALLVVKPQEMDPIEHPWIFLAEASGFEEGADRIKFISRRTRRPLDTTGHPSNLSLVSYVLAASEDEESYELYRFATPRPPGGIERSFPGPNDPDARLVARDIERFSLRFRSGGGDWLDSWDSWSPIGSSALPDEVEIQIALRSEMEDREDEEFDSSDGEEPSNLRKRRVALHMRPIDLEKQIEQALAGEGGEDGCLTVEECVKRPENKVLWQGYFEQCGQPGGCPEFDAMRSECYTPAALPDATGCDS